MECPFQPGCILAYQPGDRSLPGGGGIKDLRIRVTDEGRASLKALAARWNISLSEVGRFLIDLAAPLMDAEIYDIREALNGAELERLQAKRRLLDLVTVRLDQRLTKEALEQRTAKKKDDNSVVLRPVDAFREAMKKDDAETMRRIYEGLRPAQMDAWRRGFDREMRQKLGITRKD